MVSFVVTNLMFYVTVFLVMLKGTGELVRMTAKLAGKKPLVGEPDRRYATDGTDFGAKGL